MDDDVPARLSLRSLQTYLERLRTVFGALGCDVATATITRLLEDPKLEGLDAMTAEDIAFCRALVRSPSRQAVLFNLPWALQEKAQALLDRWDDLTPAERHAAIHAGTCAVAMLLLTRCAPLRIKNLAAIPYKGLKRWLSAPAKGGLALLLIPASPTPAEGRQPVASRRRWHQVHRWRRRRRGRKPRRLIRPRHPDSAIARGWSASRRWRSRS